MTAFKLWLEFEAVDPGNWDIANDTANIQVTLPNGKSYSLNVWTHAFLQTVIEMDKANGECLSGLYTVPPDLFVKELTRECIAATIADLLTIGSLEQLLPGAGVTAEE